MKRQIYYLLIIFFIGITSIYSQHIPINPEGHHYEGNQQGACWGYAVGRAFNRYWNDQRCDIRTLNFDSVPQNYFDWHSPFNSNEIMAGDIIAWGSTGQTHVAYVTQATGGMRLDDRPYQGGDQRTNLTLDSLIGERGYPTGYFRKKKLWSLNAENEVEGKDSVGKVGIYGNEYSGEYDSPKLADALAWESSMTLVAVFDGTLYNDYVRRFDHWEIDNGAINPPPPKTYNFTIISYNFSHNYRYTAVFKRECNVTPHNSFVGVNDPGKIIVNGDTLDGGTTIQVIETHDVTIKAPDQIGNAIQYTFDHWYDGSTQNPRTFTITSHFNPVAYYTGKPLTVTNMHYLNVSAGNKIKIAWDEQPNNNVSKYYIYLKGKDSNTGEKWGPELRATLNRGTLSYTDPIYAYTDGYTMFLLRYDVRPYYSIEQSYADSNYSAIFGGFPRGLPKSTDAGIEKQIVSNGNTAPKDFDLFQNYPNPFNPTTQIKYALKEDGFVTIKVYDLLGKVVATLVNENKPAGVYTVDFDASRLSSGIYFYTIKTNNFFDRKKMIVLK